MLRRRWRWAPSLAKNLSSLSLRSRRAHLTTTDTISLRRVTALRGAVVRGAGLGELERGGDEEERGKG